jgi:RNA recognition motif-containing protein
MVKIFVGGFPLESTELELVQLISPYATVSTIKIVRDKISRKCKGYAFLEITDESGADRVMDALDGYAIGDRVLSVNKVIEKPVTATYTKPKTSFYKPTSPGGTPKMKRPRKMM